ncbi:MAG: hypothetical protein GX896_03450 [Clostridiales bacterium]|nr:hypothetical protein [Clostridiales bacterium]
MLYCRKCKVNIAGDKICCPLCQGQLSGNAQPETEAFPIIPPTQKPNPLLIKLITFSTIAIAVISVAINFILPTDARWCWFVVAGCVCAWITSMVAIRKTGNVYKLVLQQEMVLIPLAFFWDLLTGWHNWSLDYVYPLICIIVLSVYILLSYILKSPSQDLIIYVICNCALGIIPVIFIATGILKIALPSYISVVISLLVLAAVLIFDWQTVKQEISRKFHL